MSVWARAEKHWTLVDRHAVLAVKHLRRELERLWSRAITHAVEVDKLDLARAFLNERPSFRFARSGEYSPSSGRPHFHLLLMAWSPGCLSWERWFLMRPESPGFVFDYALNPAPPGRMLPKFPVWRLGWFQRVIWKYGYARFQKVDAGPGAAGYVAGYLQKRDEYPRDGRRRPFMRTSQRLGARPMVKASPEDLEAGRLGFEEVGASGWRVIPISV